MSGLKICRYGEVYRTRLYCEEWWGLLLEIPAEVAERELDVLSGEQLIPMKCCWVGDKPKGRWFVERGGFPWISRC